MSSQTCSTVVNINHHQHHNDNKNKFNIKMILNKWENEIKYVLTLHNIFE